MMIRTKWLRKGSLDSKKLKDKIPLVYQAVLMVPIISVWTSICFRLTINVNNKSARMGIIIIFRMLQFEANNTTPAVNDAKL